MTTEKTKCLIAGSGPAGLTAAIYTGRANLSPILYEGLAPGGQLTTTTEIENFPGFPNGISGPALMGEMKQQAVRFGTEVRSGVITHADLSKRPFRITIDGEKVIEAETLIVATGAKAKYLGLESERKFRGMGVSACAICDGFFYRGRDVIVVGGGDSACEEALYLANICNKVYMVVRKQFLRASQHMQRRVIETPNIEILFGYNTVEVLGDKSGVTGALVRNENGEDRVVNAFGFFLAIGHNPNTAVFAHALDLDETGYIKTQPGTSLTNVKGVFAAGDVQDTRYRQAISAAGSGCMAAIDCERFLLEGC